MNNWHYKELLEAIDETFEDQMSQGLSATEAIGVTSENFIFYPLEENKVENLITLTETIFLCLNKLNFVFEATVRKYHQQKAFLTKQLLEADLLDWECDLLLKRIGELELQLANPETKRV